LGKFIFEFFEVPKNDSTVLDATPSKQKNLDAIIALNRDRNAYLKKARKKSWQTVSLPARKRKSAFRLFVVLDAAAKSLGRGGRSLAFESGRDGFFKIVLRDVVRDSAVVHGAEIDQLAFLVEHEEVGRDLGVQLASNLLGFVIQVGEIETPLLGPFDHLGH